MSNERQLFNKGPRPLTARGGIRAQTKSRKVGKNWWTKRWMSVLENNYMGAELPRGRAYAQAGQVLDIHIDHGCVTAKVQGPHKEPYVVTIEFQPTPKRKWNALFEEISKKAIFAAKLLTGDMPETIEEVFGSHKLSLFPKDIDDIKTVCTGEKAKKNPCQGESSNNGQTISPCRCIIAVYYLLAEEFDRDPFLFMKLRGLNRDDLIEAIGSSQPRETSQHAEIGDLIGDFEGSSLGAQVNLSADFNTFWQGGHVSDDLIGDVRVPPSAGALAKHLGHFPMWRGEERFLDALDFVYKKASGGGVDVFMGDW